MRQILIAIFSLTLILIVLIWLVMGLASFASVEPLYLDAGNCAQPCWHDVKLGATNVQDAIRVLKADPLVYDYRRNDPDLMFPCTLEWKMQTVPYYSGCMIIRPDTPISVIDLRFADDQVRLADLFPLLGRPIAAQLCYRFDFGLNHRRSVFGTVYFKNAVQVIAYHPQAGTWQLDPNMFVKLVHYDQPGAEPPIPFDAPRWQGFANAAHYGAKCS